MVKFFRRFRYTRLSDGKTIDYLKYAIGEVFLVVIGILIALQVNKWNESRKTSLLEIAYLKRLKHDLSQDTLYYNQRINQAYKSIDSNSRGIKSAYDIQHDINELGDLLVLYDYNNESLTIQNDTYYEMTSTGKLNIIKNEKLKIAVTRFYRYSNQAAKQIDDFNYLTRALLADLNTSIAILKYYPYPSIMEVFSSQIMFNDSDWSFINEPTSYKFRLLENCMMTYILKQQEHLVFFNDLKSESISVINMIERELEDHNQ
jgi:hypothetical protein